MKEQTTGTNTATESTEPQVRFPKPPVTGTGTKETN